MNTALPLDLLLFGSNVVIFRAMHVYEKTGTLALARRFVVAVRGAEPVGRAEIAAFEYIFPNMSHVLVDEGSVVVNMLGLRAVSPGA
jgi:hypothetical protein